MSREHLRFQIDYYGRGLLGVPAAPGGMEPPRHPLDDPWRVCTLALTRARQGDFGLMPTLVELHGATDDVELGHMCLGLLSVAGTAACFSQLAERVKHEPVAQRAFDLWGVLTARGALSLLPMLLDAYLASRKSREAERLTDFIGTLVGDALFPFDPDDYEDVVRACHQRMLDSLGDEHALVFQGERQGVPRLAKHILRHHESPSFLLGWKLAFEAATGWDCGSWYQGRTLQPRAVAATVEAFLESDEASGYEDGVRYFFGHRIDPRLIPKMG